MTKIRLIWKCGYCGDVVISYSSILDDMNFCECGRSGVDLEPDMERVFGKVKDISRKEFIKDRWKPIKTK